MSNFSFFLFPNIFFQFNALNRYHFVKRKKIVKKKLKKIYPTPLQRTLHHRWNRIGKRAERALVFWSEVKKKKQNKKKWGGLQPYLDFLKTQSCEDKNEIKTHKKILTGGQVSYKEMILLDGLPLAEHVLWVEPFSY